MGKKKRNALGMRPAYIENAIVRDIYLDMLAEVAINVFNWQNLPPEIDQRFLELTLMEKGFALFFRDEIAERYIALTTMISGPLTIYRQPSMRKAYAVNGYRANRTAADSVLIYNNSLRQPTWPTLCYYAEKIAQIEMSLRTNLKATRTPVLLACDESQRLTLKNVYSQYDGDEPVIFGNKNLIDPKIIQSIKTDAPFIADQLFALKQRYLNEAMMYLGVQNSNTEKSERLNTDEVISNLGQTNAMKYTRLEMRQQACREINRMFGLNVWVEYHRDLIPADSRETEVQENVEVYDRTEIPD